jgi:hypothetical protein
MVSTICIGGMSMGARAPVIGFAISVAADQKLALVKPTSFQPDERHGRRAKQGRKEGQARKEG